MAYGAARARGASRRCAGSLLRADQRGRADPGALAKIVGACIEFISGPLSVDPHWIGKPLQRELAGYPSARRGAYRAVYRIDDSVRTVVVVRVDHRGDVYRSR
ncbi:MAG: type II toxin-antitoxin system RelE family toxin [Pseudonocardiaceae bacterium]